MTLALRVRGVLARVGLPTASRLAQLEDAARNAPVVCDAAIFRSSAAHGLIPSAANLVGAVTLAFGRGAARPTAGAASLRATRITVFQSSLFARCRSTEGVATL